MEDDGLIMDPIKIREAINAVFGALDGLNLTTVEAAFVMASVSAGIRVVTSGREEEAEEAEE